MMMMMKKAMFESWDDLDVLNLFHQAITAFKASERVHIQPLLLLKEGAKIQTLYNK